MQTNKEKTVNSGKMVNEIFRDTIFVIIILFDDFSIDLGLEVPTNKYPQRPRFWSHVLDEPIRIINVFRSILYQLDLT